MKKFSLLTGLLFLFIFTQAQKPQGTIFYTYKDFKADKGVPVGEYKMKYHVMGRYVMKFEGEMGKTKVEMHKIWGFALGEGLFRINERGFPVRLLSNGKVCYYGNGFAHMSMIIQNTNEGTYRDGYAYYFSNDINSEIVPYSGRKYKKWKKANEGKHRKLFSCFEDKDKEKAECVFEYNKEEEEERR